METMLLFYLGTGLRLVLFGGLFVLAVYLIKLIRVLIRRYKDCENIEKEGTPMIQVRFIAWIFFIVFAAMAWILLLNREIPLRKRLALLGCLLSVMLITAFCFFPFPIQAELIEDLAESRGGEGLQLIPFGTILPLLGDAVTSGELYSACVQLGGNILLFLPLGFSLVCFLGRERFWKRALLGVLAISLLVEGIQWLFNGLLGYAYRVADVDDVLLNLLGGALGMLAAYLIQRLKSRRSASGNPS